MSPKSAPADRTDANAQAVLHAAMTLVAANGLKGLSLRPLADQLGSTVSALTHRFGLKDELLATLIDTAMTQDVAFLDRWLQLIRDLDVRDGVLMADLADAVLNDMAGPEALRTRFYCELLQGVVSRPEIAPLVAAWSRRRLGFWLAATEKLHKPDLGEALHAFSTEEAAHGLALGDIAAYRWLRRLSLHRLCCGLFPTEGSTDLQQFQVFHAALGDLVAQSQQQGEPAMTEWQKNAASHISMLIIAEGADAVTHRAIAARAGIPNSTLAHHFPRREDLLRAGLADIVERVRQLNDAAARPSERTFDMTSLEVSRATFAISLAATNMPELKAQAADMRRRRGENYVVHLNRKAEGRSIDVLSAQALSVTGMGRWVLDAVLDPAPNAAALALVDRLYAAARSSAEG